MDINYILDHSRQDKSSNLMEGDTGSEVIILQDKLKILGYYDSSITSSFDEYTRGAVMKFQQEQNLTPTGIVDRETWDILYQLTNFDGDSLNERQARPTLRLGSTGIYVTELQTLLTNLLYYNGTIDGNFGSSTQTAVKMFQTNNRLTPDGIVGRDTWSALETLYSPMAICEEENNGENIINYTVVRGDTLWNIAQRFHTTVDTIKRLNNLTSDMLMIGQILRIPTTGETPPNNIVYTVVAGDTLWKIAQRFHTTVDAIKRINNLTSDNLRIGQQLIIPSSDQSLRVYTVVRGDSLWSIAQKFNTTVDAIKRRNNLTSNNLQIGQQLMIP